MPIDLDEEPIGAFERYRPKIRRKEILAKARESDKKWNRTINVESEAKAAHKPRKPKPRVVSNGTKKAREATNPRVIRYDDVPEISAGGLSRVITVADEGEDEGEDVEYEYVTVHVDEYGNEVEIDENSNDYEVVEAISKAKVLIKNLPRGVTERDLALDLLNDRDPTEIMIMKKNAAAEIGFRTKEEAQAVLKELDGAAYQGQRLKVIMFLSETDPAIATAASNRKRKSPKASSAMSSKTNQFASKTRRTGANAKLRGSGTGSREHEAPSSSMRVSGPRLVSSNVVNAIYDDDEEEDEDVEFRVVDSYGVGTEEAEEAKPRAIHFATTTKGSSIRGIASSGIPNQNDQKGRKKKNVLVKKPVKILKKSGEVIQMGRRSISFKGNIKGKNGVGAEVGRALNASGLVTVSSSGKKALNIKKGILKKKRHPPKGLQVKKRPGMPTSKKRIKVRGAQDTDDDVSVRGFRFVVRN